MSLGKLILVVTLLSISSPAFAAKTVKRFGIGAGYMIFSEQLKVVESGTQDQGTANYAGLVAFAEHTWTKNRTIYQAALGMAAGKASAGLFNGASYPDSGKRAWNMFYFEGSIYHRIDPKISIGGGLMGGNRSADWKSEANPGLQVKGLNKTVYAPEFLLRWNVNRRMTLVQSIATPDFRGTTMWRWTAQYNL